MHWGLAVKLEPAAWSDKGLGNTLHALGRYEEAAEAQTRAIELDPGSARTWRQAARSENARGRYESALKMAQHSAELEHDDYWTWMEIGTALEHLGRADEAMDAYQRAISISPGQCAAARAGVKRLSGAGK